MTVFTLSVYHSSNFNSCSERLCEGIGQTLRKDDSCDRTLAMYMLQPVTGDVDDMALLGCLHVGQKLTSIKNKVLKGQCHFFFVNQTVGNHGLVW